MEVFAYVILGFGIFIVIALAIIVYIIKQKVNKVRYKIKIVNDIYNLLK